MWPCLEKPHRLTGVAEMGTCNLSMNRVSIRGYRYDKATRWENVMYQSQLGLGSNFGVTTYLPTVYPWVCH